MNLKTKYRVNDSEAGEFDDGVFYVERRRWCDFNWHKAYGICLSRDTALLLIEELKSGKTNFKYKFQITTHF